jgi:azurin
MKRHLLTYLTFTILFSACGGKSTDSDSPAQTTEEAIPAVAEITIEGNDLMQYNLNTIEVFAGQRVKLTLKHVGKMPVEVMGHNWVLLTPGTDKMDFGTKAVAAKDTDYIPPSEVDKVIAHTKTIGGGEETSIEFDAPAEGSYEFICSFPGHFATMNGTFTVKARPAG